jgi:ribosome maturation factor RimP
VNSQRKSLEAWLEKVEKIAQDVAQREGCILYDVENSGSGKGRILRIYIDKEGGVGIEDCSNVSKGLNLLLDVEDVVPGAMYNLEVSTPGLDRRLTKKWHYEKAVGKKIFVQLTKSLGNIQPVEDKGLVAMKKFEEVLESVSEDGLIFKIRTTDVKIPFSNIEKAKMVFEYKTNPKKK